MKNTSSHFRIKPFASSYYVIHNKHKTFLLILLIASSMICYLGALFVTDSLYDFYRNREMNRHVIVVNKMQEQNADFLYELLKQNISEFEHVQIAIPISNETLIMYEAAMGFDNSYFTYGFLSEEDFNHFNQVCKIMPEDFVLKDKEIVMSEMLADNIGVKIGDVITKDHERIEGVVNPLTVAATYKGDTYQLFFVDSDIEESAVMLLRKADDNNGKRLVESVMPKADRYGSLNFYDYDSIIGRLEKQLESLMLIFYGIVLLVTVVLAITINATFQTAFEKRKFEFSIYKAIGFSRNEIMRKVLGEVFIIDAAGIAAGFILIFVFLIFLNAELLIPSGKKLDYYCIEGAGAILVCNLIIVIPMILSQIKRVKTCNIMEY